MNIFGIISYKSAFNPFIPDGNLSSRTQFLIMEATVVQ